MKKYNILSLMVVSATCMADGGVFWHCTAVNDKGAVWNQYGQTRSAARSLAQKACFPFNNHKSCRMVCFPPRVYWRCLSHDTLPMITKDNKDITAKQGTWYWTSFSRQIAINGARDACRHNSQYGGCYVDESACASSTGKKEVEQ